MTEENRIQPYKTGALTRMRKLSAMVGDTSSPYPDGEIDFRYVVRVLRDRCRTVLAAAGAVVLIALAVSLFMKPIYRSQAIIEIKESTPDIESLQHLEARNAAPRDVMATEIETEIGFLKSEAVARQVIDQLRLADQQQPSFSVLRVLKAKWNAVAKWFTGSDDDSQKKKELDAKTYQVLLNSFESALSVSRVEGSRLVEVSYESGDPHLSARVVNSVVSNYLQLHEKSTERLTKGLAKQVQEAKKELERSEWEMTGYARRNGLLYLQSDSGTSQNIVDERLRQIQDELTKAQANRYQKESVYQLVQKGDYGSLPGVFQDKLLQDLTVQAADLKRQYGQLSSTFTDNYPKVQQVKNQLAAIEKVLARERQRAAANITNDYLASVRREALLLHALQQQKNAATDVAEKSNQYNILKRNTETDNKLYESLLQKVKEASLIAQIKANNVDVVDKAEAQFFPVKPKIMLNLALALIAGLGLGIALAFLQEHLDTTLRTVDEVDRFLGVPALAMIPAVESLPSFSGNGNHKALDRVQFPSEFDPTVLTSSERPWYRIDKQICQGYSPLIEAFRALGSAVMFEAKSRNRALRSLVVCSSQPGEGKTTVSVNLAIALAQQGSRILLIDADLRRPSVHRALGLRNVHGLAAYLTGKTEWVPCVLAGLTPGLDTLPAGRTEANPVALLSSSRMKTLIGQALEDYDYVIIDSPALMMNLADARIIAGLVDGTIMVVRSGMAPREFVLRAQKLLNNLVGVVLNSMDMRSMEGYYGYQSYYGYAAGSEEKPEGSIYEK